MPCYVYITLYKLTFCILDRVRLRYLRTNIGANGNNEVKIHKYYNIRAIHKSVQLF